MLFHTHVYYSKNVDKNLDSLKIIGSFIPDLAVTSAISWDDLHKKKNISDFFSYVEKSKPEFTSLLRGINYHNTLDYLTHTKYKNSVGYAYSTINSELISLVSKAHSIDEAQARTNAHSYIESAVEFFLLNENSTLVKVVKDAVREINCTKLSKLFARFYKKGEKEMFDSINFLISYATKYNLRDINGFVMMWSEYSEFFLKREADTNLVKEALQLSCKLSKNTYREFLNIAIATKETEIKDCN